MERRVFVSLDAVLALVPALPARAQDKKYRCMVCSHVYDPAAGDPETGVAPGTPFEKLPADWVCPDSGNTKGDFEPVEDWGPVRQRRRRANSSKVVRPSRSRRSSGRASRFIPVPATRSPRW